MAKQKRKIISHDNNLYIIGEEDFDPKKIFENGQAFRWAEQDGAYTFVADKYIVRAKKYPESATLPPIVVLENAGSMEDYENFWRNFFDMDRDYAKLRRDLSKLDKNLKKATAHGKGLRILKQDLFEMIICFIISSNNNIARIKGITAKLCALAGESLGRFHGEEYFRFPTPAALAKLDAQTIQTETGAGYRAEYIVKTAQMIADGAVDLEKIPSMSYEQAHAELCKLHGIGPKVADCILLFGNSMDIAFPVDTWVIKLMKHFYGCEEKSAQKIKQRGFELFGEKAGLAQQYLFYYARENKIGTKENR